MPSINLDNLERYDSKARNEAEEEYMPKDSGNWQKTEEAGAVSFYPVGGSALEGKVKFSFKETPPASGDKSPENPSTISGVSEVKVTRCGKNLFTYPYYDSPQTINNVEWTVLSDGSVVANGTTPANTRSVFCVTYGKILPAGTYTLYLNPGILSVCDSYLSYGSTTIWGNANPRTFTLSTPQTVNCYLRVAAGATVDNYKYTPQLEIGSVRTGFEKGEGTDYPLPLGNTYYGGEIDLATGLMTVTWWGVVLTGEETVTEVDMLTEGVHQYSIAVPYYCVNDLTAQTCTHFDAGIYTAGTDHFYVRSGAGAAVRFFSDSISNAQGFEEFLTAQNVNGTPVTIAYQLATPYTVQLSPLSLSALAQTDKCTSRLNTVYTDADTIQIGYMKSPQRTEQEITQALLEIESNDSD